jgi:hypothetical protein
MILLSFGMSLIGGLDWLDRLDGLGGLDGLDRYLDNEKFELDVK